MRSTRPNGQPATSDQYLRPAHTPAPGGKPSPATSTPSAPSPVTQTPAKHSQPQSKPNLSSAEMPPNRFIHSTPQHPIFGAGWNPPTRHYGTPQPSPHYTASRSTHPSRLRSKRSRAPRNNAAHSQNVSSSHSAPRNPSPTSRQQHSSSKCKLATSGNAQPNAQQSHSSTYSASAPTKLSTAANYSSHNSNNPPHHTVRATAKPQNGKNVSAACHAMCVAHANTLQRGTTPCTYSPHTCSD